MKRYKGFLIGLIVGVALATSGTVFADSISSMLGKKVDATYRVMVDGDFLPTDAISIEGTSYLPVRNFAETVSYAVYWNDDTKIIRLNKKEVAPVPVESTTDNQTAINSNFQSPQVFIDDPVKANEELIKLYNIKISELESRINHLDHVIQLGEQDAATVGITSEQFRASQRYQDYLSQVGVLQSQLSQAQAELAALQ